MVAMGWLGVGCGGSGSPSGTPGMAGMGGAAGVSGRSSECDTLPPLAQKSSYTFGFVQTYEVGNPWRDTNTSDMLAEAQSRGYTLMFNAPTSSDAQEQVARMQALIDAKVDAIILCPTDATVLAPTVVAARKACIPVFTENRLLNATLTIPGTDYVTGIGADPVVQGQLIADWMIAQTNGQANVIELEGTTGSSSAVGRKMGFATEIASHTGMSVLASQTGNFTQQGGHDVAAMLMTANPTANAFFTHNDLMALGAIQAIQEAGKDPKSFTIVSIDGSKAGTQAIIDGTFGATEVNNPRFGKIVFDTIEQYAAGMTIPNRIVTKGQIVDKTNAMAYLPMAF
jgi:ribose transport system substrate-binding protein